MQLRSVVSSAYAKKKKCNRHCSDAAEVRGVFCAKCFHTTVSKETYYSVKRDLLQCQKRPTTKKLRVPHLLRVGSARTLAHPRTHTHTRAHTHTRSTHVHTHALKERDPYKYSLTHARARTHTHSALFALDAFAGGFAMQTFIVLWFERRWFLNPVALGRCVCVCVCVCDLV